MRVHSRCTRRDMTPGDCTRLGVGIGWGPGSAASRVVPTSIGHDVGEFMQGHGLGNSGLGRTH